MTAGPLLADGLKMIAVLVLIVGGLIFLNHYVRRHLTAGGIRPGRRRISVLENAHLGVKKSIAMVQVPGAVLVLGVTADRITLLERIDDADEAFGESPSNTETAPVSSFKDHLRRLAAPLGGRSSATRIDAS
ncbi:MAG: flagellar biosynthetic protein FliO [Desulfosarcina sp.]|nr:flagellar biosynthetic protein FliO [Desulfobacterales bacterium]